MLGQRGRVRSAHPQVSVTAVGADAHVITRRQPFSYALGARSPFASMHELGAHILLIGVGHNRNSFLHHAESLVGNHRRKVRRFPYLVEGQRVWLEAADVGDDNDTHFPRIGAEFGDTGSVRTRVIGSARCQLIECVPFIDHAKRRLHALLA